MNIENINSAIAIITRHMEANHILDMADWQTPIGVLENYDNEDTNIMYKETHLCGTPCCFAGYVAVSPEFQEDGGDVSPTGAPVINGVIEDDAIREWFGCSVEQATSLCAADRHRRGIAYPYVPLGGKVEFPDVIAALVSLRDTRLLPGE